MTRPLIISHLLTAQDDGATGRAAYATTLARARSAEAAGIDALLIDDGQAAGQGRSGEFEAGTLAAALAVATRRIGIIAAISTDQLAPYHVARTLATLDHLSGGRAGWQAIASGSADEAANYGGAAPVASERRLARAEEFARVLTGLWDSFDDDAFLRDRESGVYFVPDKLRALDHKGDFFDVAGPLNIARPPQGHPVLVRRVESPGDAEFAGRLADIAIVPSGRSGAEVAGLVRAAVLGSGRARADVLVLLETSAEADPDVADVDGYVLLPPGGDAEPAHAAVLERAQALRGETEPSTHGTLRARLGLPRPASRLTAV